MDWQSISWSALGLLAAITGGALLHALLFRLLRGVLDRRAPALRDSGLFERLRWPSLSILTLLAIQLALPAIEMLPAVVRHLLTLLAYGAIVWLVLALIGGLEILLRGSHDVDVADNLAARRAHTQIVVLARALMALVVIVGASAALMTFPRVRELGTALLASAGIAGLVIGLAARPVLENLLAGLQIALTQPIRLDDVVVIDGEWGRVEEIAATYVVLRIWDQRRLIVPFSKIIGEPFQNWTRRSAEILGSIFIYTDYRCPVQSVREELQRICQGNEHWDGKVCVLQVTDATEQSVQLRALVSSKDSPTAWELRVLIREKLIEFLQREYPDCLPRTRVEIESRES